MMTRDQFLNFAQLYPELQAFAASLADSPVFVRSLWDADLPLWERLSLLRLAGLSAEGRDDSALYQFMLDCVEEHLPFLSAAEQRIFQRVQRAPLPHREARAMLRACAHRQRHAQKAFRALFLYGCFPPQKVLHSTGVWEVVLHCIEQDLLRGSDDLPYLRDLHYSRKLHARYDAAAVEAGMQRLPALADFLSTYPAMQVHAVLKATK